MTDPKETIYNKLSEVTGANVYQTRPEVIENLPAVTFNIQSNVPKYNLDKEIAKQDIVVKVDLWGNTSNDTAALLVQVEALMLELDYRLTFNQDLVDPSGISHLTTQFTY